MTKYQIIEREGSNSVWSVPSGHDRSRHFDTEEEAIKAAKQYVTEVNMDNALASSEKESAAELFFMDNKGAYLGTVDGEDVYMEYKRNLSDPRDRTKTVHAQGETVKDTTYYELEHKGEVQVRVVPGT